MYSILARLNQQLRHPVCGSLPEQVFANPMDKRGTAIIRLQTRRGGHNLSMQRAKLIHTELFDDVLARRPVFLDRR